MKQSTPNPVMFRAPDPSSLLIVNDSVGLLSPTYMSISGIFAIDMIIAELLAGSDAGKLRLLGTP